MQTTSKQYDVGVVVARFQNYRLTAGHRDLLDYVCGQHEKVIIFLGVSPLWATSNNPLDFQARAQMILAEYPTVLTQYIDDVGSDDKWSAKLDRQVTSLVSPAQSVVLYGSRDSFLPHYTGKFDTRELEPQQVVSGTAERKSIAAGNTKATEDFRAGVIWATQARYPTSYQAIDVAILSEDRQRILLGRKPGEDHYRFVGGFVDPRDESLEATVAREAAEETGLTVQDVRYVGSHRVDDWRYRSERDKIMTALFVCTAGGTPAPDDDIEEVKWFDLTIPGDALVNEHLPLYTMLMRYILNISKGA